MSSLGVKLQCKTIIGHAAGPHLLITGGVHGDEFEPMAAVRRLMRAIEPAQLRGKVTLAPVVNEPAFALRSRVAEDGKDLARACPGRDDGTITERIAAALARLIRSADFYIDLHSAGALYQILPLAGYVLHANASVLDQQRVMARVFDLPIVWGTSARLDGRSLSVARDANVPAIYVECGGGCDPRDVEKCVQGCLRVASALGMLESTSAAHGVQYVVEDDRDQAGHLQAQHPSPAAGYFEPIVALGQVAQRGELLGRVVDALGESPIDVPLDGTGGTVLFLRRCASVACGIALAAILPISSPGEMHFGRDDPSQSGPTISQ